MTVRVLQVITRLIVGGAQETVLDTAALIDKGRFQVDVLSGPQTGSEGSLIDEARQRGLALTLLPELVRQVSPWNDLKAVIKLYRFMKRGRYTIVHTNSSKAGLLGRIAARLAGVPVIVHTVHGWSFHDYMTPLARGVYILLERLCATFTTALIVVAQRDIEKGLKAGIGRPRQYHLIRSAISLDDFDPSRFYRRQVRQELGLPPEAPVLGCIGRFSAQKNPLDWVRVAGKIGRLLPECAFLLVGDGPLRPQVEALLVEEGIASRTVLTGLRRDVPRLLAACDVFLLTSLWEGLPRVIPQAMAMGLPVVATSVDGSSEAIQPGLTGYLCQPADLEGLAHACLELLSNPALRSEMGQNAHRAAAEGFDLNQMIQKIEALYNELIPKENTHLQQ